MADARVGKPWLFFSIIAVIFAVALAGTNKISENCSEPYRHDTTIGAGKQNLRVENADTQAEQEKGLSDRACIGDNEGMLFTFEQPGYYNFWMKDMNFPIDIVWIDETKHVIEVTENIQPSTYPDTFTSNRTPKYVLEVGASRAGQLGLIAGQSLDF